MDPITSNIMPIDPLVTRSQRMTQAQEETPQVSFDSFLSDAMNNAVAADVSDQVNSLENLAGYDHDLHTNMLETSKAELTLNLAIQIRNKVVDSYNEIMRMQV